VFCTLGDAHEEQLFKQWFVFLADQVIQQYKDFENHTFKVVINWRGILFWRNKV